MRNPALQLVGITASPEGGGSLFGTRAEEELCRWLETRLDALGINPVAYSRFVLSLLRQPDSALTTSTTPPLTAEAANFGKGGGNHNKGRRARAKLRSSSSKLPSTTQYGDKEQRQAVVQCLKSAADKKGGVESLVDELCAKLRDLESGGDVADPLKTASNIEEKTESSLEALNLQDQVPASYSAFPVLESSLLSKNSYWEEKNFYNNNSSNVNFNNNNNNNHCSLNNNKNSRKSKLLADNNNKINKSHQRKSKLEFESINPQIISEKEFEFAKLMEQERDRQKAEERELDQLQLAQLQAKFDESLEALWDSNSGNSQSTDSIWAAPSLSIPSGPLWPVDTSDSSYPMITLEQSERVETPPCQDSQTDESPLIPWDIDLFSIEDYVDEAEEKEKPKCNVNWSDSKTDSPWFWGKLNKLVNNPTECSGGYVSIISGNKSPVAIAKEQSYFQQKVVVDDPEPDEDLLTSTRTHFRPIKEDGHWADGTTFPINNNLERISYQRSESGNLLYLPGCESPYMEYRENSFSPLVESSKLTLKFRIQQCDKGIQTEPVFSPVKRRILAEQENFYFASEDSDSSACGQLVVDDIEKDSFSMNYLGWNQTILHLHAERKRKHSSSFNLQPTSVFFGSSKTPLRE